MLDIKEPLTRRIKVIDQMVRRVREKKRYWKLKIERPELIQKYHNTNFAKRRSRKKWFNDLKEKSPCTDCGKFFPGVCLDYDHRDVNTKIENISILMANSAPTEKILAEIAKCDIVCACCHRLRTQKRGYVRPTR